MREAAQKRLKEVEALKVGAGALEAYAFGRGTFREGEAGLGVDYSHRINRSWSLFGQGELGYRYGMPNSGLGYSVLAGVKGVW